MTSIKEWIQSICDYLDPVEAERKEKIREIFQVKEYAAPEAVKGNILTEYDRVKYLPERMWRLEILRYVRRKCLTHIEVVYNVNKGKYYVWEMYSEYEGMPYKELYQYKVDAQRFADHLSYLSGLEILSD